MPVPILQLGDVLIATLRADLTDTEWRAFQDRLLHRVGEDRARAVVVDVAQMDVMDSFATRTLRSTVEMLRLRGAEAAVCGIQPEVALAMTQLGLGLPGTRTAQDLDGALRALGRGLRLEKADGT